MFGGKKQHYFDSWPTFPLLSECSHWLQTDAQMLFKVLLLFFLIIVKTPTTKKPLHTFFTVLCPISLLLCVFFCLCVLLLSISIIYAFNPLFSVDFIGGFDPFPLYHVNEKSSHLLLKPMYP